MESFIKFENLRPTGSTKIVRVCNSAGGSLGVIKFWGAWRQYTFQPNSDTVFNTACLNDINVKLEDMNQEIREEWKLRRKAKEINEDDQGGI